MSRLVGLACVALLLLSQAIAVLGQLGRDELPKISVVGTRTLFAAEIELKSNDGPFFVPYCGTGESGTRFLCTRGTHLEEKSPQGWRRAKVRVAASLGGSSLLSVPNQLVSAGTNGSFMFVFDPEIFGIPPRTLLRVVVDVWSDKESRVSGAPPIQVTSPEFMYPSE